MVHRVELAPEVDLDGARLVRQALAFARLDLLALQAQADGQQHAEGEPAQRERKPRTAQRPGGGTLVHGQAGLCART